MRVICYLILFLYSISSLGQSKCSDFKRKPLKVKLKQEKNWHINIFILPNVHKFYIDYPQYATGITQGINCGFKLSDRLSFQSGIAYYNIKRDIQYWGMNESEYFDVDYLEFPINLKFKILKKQTIFNPYILTGINLVFGDYYDISFGQDNRIIPFDYHDSFFDLAYGVMLNQHKKISIGFEATFKTSLLSLLNRGWSDINYKSLFGIATIVGFEF